MSVCLLLSLAAVAQAAQVPPIPDMDVRSAHATLDAGPTLWTDTAERGAEPFSTRLLLDYSKDPMVFRGDYGGEYPVLSDLLSADLLLAGGWRALRFGAIIPMVISAEGMVEPANGLGDPAVDGKAVLLDSPAVPVRVALGGRLGLPMATVGSPLSAGGLSWQVSGIADLPLEDGLVSLNLGVGGHPEAELQNITLQRFFLARLAASYAFLPALGASTELAGRVYLGDARFDAAGTPMEWLASLWVQAAEPLIVHCGVGSALSAGIGAPDYRLLMGLGYEPGNRVVDRDGDAVADRGDGCPSAPEDHDGFQDEDGCPDDDNDGDGLLDTADACPLQPEDSDGVQDQDGCPEPEGRVLVRLVSAESGQPIPVGRLDAAGAAPCLAHNEGCAFELAPGTRSVAGSAPGFMAGDVSLRVLDAPQSADLVLSPNPDSFVRLGFEGIQLVEPLQFVANSATLRPEGAQVLSQVADLLAAYPEITRLRIEAHSSSRGNDAWNLALTVKRAEAIQGWLQARGIAPERLVVKGYGETQPLVSNDDAAGRAINERVVLAIEAWR